MKRNKTQLYTQAFKDEVIAQIKQGADIKRTAKKFKVTPISVEVWRYQAEHPGVGFQDAKAILANGRAPKEHPDSNGPAASGSGKTEVARLKMRIRELEYERQALLAALRITTKG